MQRPKSKDIIIMGSHTPSPDVCTQCGCNDRAEEVIRAVDEAEQTFSNGHIQASSRPVPSYHKNQTCHLCIYVYVGVWVHAWSREKISPFTVLFCSLNAPIMYLHLSIFTDISGLGLIYPTPPRLTFFGAPPATPPSNVLLVKRLSDYDLRLFAEGRPICHSTPASPWHLKA